MHAQGYLSPTEQYINMIYYKDVFLYNIPSSGFIVMNWLSNRYTGLKKDKNRKLKLPNLFQQSLDHGPYKGLCVKYPGYPFDVRSSSSHLFVLVWISAPLNSSLRGTPIDIS